MITRISRKKSWFVVSVLLLVLVAVLKTAQSMEQTSLNSNANSVVQLHNGFVGVILISVKLATKSNAVVITCQKNLETNYPNVAVLQSAQ